VFVNRNRSALTTEMTRHGPHRIEIDRLAAS
jgi:hypothetical protein